MSSSGAGTPPTRAPRCRTGGLLLSRHVAAGQVAGPAGLDVDDDPAVLAAERHVLVVEHPDRRPSPLPCLGSPVTSTSQNIEVAWAPTTSYPCRPPWPRCGTRSGPRSSGSRRRSPAGRPTRPAPTRHRTHRSSSLCWWRARGEHLPGARRSMRPGRPRPRRSCRPGCRRASAGTVRAARCRSSPPPRSPAPRAGSVLSERRRGPGAVDPDAHARKLGLGVAAAGSVPWLTASRESARAHRSTGPDARRSPATLRRLRRGPPTRRPTATVYRHRGSTATGWPGATTARCRRRGPPR